MASDWRNAADYDYLDNLDVSGLAWECLRRNARYRADYPQMRDGLKSPAAWGLRFPG
ncbi:transcriptional regulator domain-containing protein [Gymnodinialimonas mytili]|uniref:transcriptional regulator domain-containing protein n=1 Tax=Gymnodinialimonas mytili TaxID=3126503 RepID=UPI003F72B670